MNLVQQFKYHMKMLRDHNIIMNIFCITALLFLAATSACAEVNVRLGAGGIHAPDERIATDNVGMVEIEWRSGHPWWWRVRPYVRRGHMSAYNNGRDDGHEYWFGGIVVNVFGGDDECQR